MSYKAIIAYCCLLATGLIVLCMFMFERSRIDAALTYTGNGLAFFLHWAGIAVAAVFIAAYLVGIVYAYIWLRERATTRVIRPSRAGHKAQLFIDSEGTAHRIDFDFEMFTGFLDAVKQLPATTVNQFLGEAQEQLAIDAPGSFTKFDIPAVRLSDAMGKLRRNLVQVYWGRREDGSDFIEDLERSVHTRKSGKTNKGKSYLTRSQLYQLHTMNDPEVIQFAYFDLEGETTEPFWNAPHTWTIGDEIPAIADDISHVCPLLEALVGELEARDKSKDKRFPYLLIVMEEAEDLLDSIKEDLPRGDFKKCVRLLKTLARRGRKRRMYLDMNVQNTYKDPTFRAAGNQFQLRLTASQDAAAARAGGFTDTALLNRLAAADEQGIFVVNHGEEFAIRSPLIDVDMPVWDELPEPEDRETPVADYYDEEPAPEPLPNYPTDYRTTENIGRKTVDFTLVADNTSSPVAARKPLPETLRRPVAESRTTGLPVADFTPEEVPQLIKAYQFHGSIDKVLRSWGRGQQYYASASRILKEAGKLKV